MKSYAYILAGVVVLGAIGLLTGSPAQAADCYWTNNGSGTFSDPANWFPGVPGAADNAFFTNNAIYTVTWTAGATNANAYFDGTTATNILAVGANTWTITNLVIGQSATAQVRVQHTSGTIIVTNATRTGQVIIRENASSTALFDMIGGTLIADRFTSPNNGFTWNFYRGTLTTREGVTIGDGVVAAQFLFGSQYAGVGDSVWNITGGTNVMNIGSGNQIFMISYNNTLGAAYGTATLNISGQGTVLTNTGRIYVGWNSGVAKLVVSNGAAFYCNSASDSYLATSAGCLSNTVIVTGSNSLWQMNNAGLYIGNSGTNTLIISDGGRVAVGVAVVKNAGLGWGSGACQGLVTGTNSWWDVSGSLTIGNGSGSSSNLLTVSSGGAVRANGLVVGADLANSGNALTVSNGNLYVTNVAKTAKLDVRNGILTIAESGGSVRTSAMAVTNSSTLKFVVAVNGITPVTVDDTLTLDSSAKLMVDISNCHTGGTFTLVSYASKVNAFAASNITITGSSRFVVPSVDQETGNKITVHVPLVRGTIFTIR